MQSPCIFMMFETILINLLLASKDRLKYKTSVQFQPYISHPEMKLRLQNYLNNQNHIQNTSDFQVNYDSPSPPAAERYFLANNDATNL